MRTDFEESEKPSGLCQSLINPTSIEAGVHGSLSLIPESQGTFATLLPIANFRALPESGHCQEGQYQTWLDSLSTSWVEEVAKETWNMKKGEPIIRLSKKESQVRRNASGGGLSLRHGESLQLWGGRRKV